jgi:hypothetical protein
VGIFIAIAYTAFPWTRYTFWDVNAGALSEYIYKEIGIGFGLIFPSFIRASGWTMRSQVFGRQLQPGCIWKLVQRSAHITKSTLTTSSN